jgi:hypothetical protein
MYALFYTNDLRKKVVRRIIDLDNLKKSFDNGSLNGAVVFARLLGIDDNSQFKEEEFKKNLFLDYGITCIEWDNLMIFLKYGEINDIDLRGLKSITNILGGIPSFDVYYKKRLEEKKEEYKPYNPLTPEDDIKKYYLWACLKNFTTESQYDLLKIGYSLCSINIENQYHFYRKKKK